MSPVEKQHERGLNGALAAEIRAEMGVRQVSGHQLAADAGIDRLTLRRYLKAERAWTTANLEAVAHALGLDPGDLMIAAVRRRDANPSLYGPESGGAASLRAVAKKGGIEGAGDAEQ